MPSFNLPKDPKVDLKKAEKKLLKEPAKFRGTEMTKKKFLANAGSRTLEIFGETLELKPKKFQKGKVGFFANAKMPYKVADKNYTLQGTYTFYVPESEKWLEGEDDPEEDEEDEDGDEEDDEDTSSADEEKSPKPAFKRIKAEKGHFMFRNIWIKDAPEQTLKAFGRTLTLFPKESKNSGSVGYFCDREFAVVVDGEEFTLKASANATVIGSKAWPRA